MYAVFKTIENEERIVKAETFKELVDTLKNCREYPESDAEFIPDEISNDFFKKPLQEIAGAFNGQIVENYICSETDDESIQCGWTVMIDIESKTLDNKDQMTLSIDVDISSDAIDEENIFRFNAYAMVSNEYEGESVCSRNLHIFDSEYNINAIKELIKEGKELFKEIH